MAKKSIASVQSLEKNLTKVIRTVRSPKTGAYTFTEKVIPKSEVKNFLDKK
jgi:hypothetical protein